MASSPNNLLADSDFPPCVIMHEPASPRFSFSGTPTAGVKRKIGIAVDLSDESAYAVTWSVQHYLRPGDAVVILHIRPTSILYGTDWGFIPPMDFSKEKKTQQNLEDDFDNLTKSKLNELAQPLGEGRIPFKIRIVKDHDMMERLCLEVERLGLSSLIMGSRGLGAGKAMVNGRLGSVSSYCVNHCVCPVVVVRSPDEMWEIKKSMEMSDSSSSGNRMERSDSSLSGSRMERSDSSLSGNRKEEEGDKPKDTVKIS